MVADFNDNHGPAFRAKAHEIGAAFGEPIPLTDKTYDLDFAPEAIKPLAVLLCQSARDQRLVYAVINAKVAQDNIAAIAARYGGDVPGSDTFVGVFQIASAPWQRIAQRSPAQRNVDYRLKRHYLTDRLALDGRSAR